MSRFPATFLALVMAAPVAGQTTAIVDVTIIDVDAGTKRAGMTVAISGDRITTVGESDLVELPDGAEVVDGTGRYLIPGLWDMHAHTSTVRITRDVILPLFVANGVTGIRNMAADCFERGSPSCVPPDLPDPLPSVHDFARWRQEMESGRMIGPRVVASSANLHGPAPGEPSTPQNPGTPADARAHVRLLKERGVDFIKVYSEFPRDAYFALMDEARRMGLPVAGHVPVLVRASEAATAGQASLEHIGPGNELEECSPGEVQLRRQLLDELTGDSGFALPVLAEIAATYDTALCARVFKSLVENDTWVTPTLMVARLPSEIEVPWQNDARRRFLAQTELDYWTEWDQIFTSLLGTAADQATYSTWIRRVVREMRGAGVRFLAGTDAGYPGIYWGSTIHEELRLLVSAGLTELEALRAATSAPAEFLGREADLGSVEPGKFADLVLLDGDPLANIGNTERIAAVFVRGRLFDRSDLDSLLRAAADAAGAG